MYCNPLGRVDIYKQLTLVELFIGKIKPYRRICSRFEKLKQPLLIGTYPLTPVTRFASL